MTANTECDALVFQRIKAGDLSKDLAEKDEPVQYQLVGEVMAYQGDDVQVD